MITARCKYCLRRYWGFRASWQASCCYKEDITFGPESEFDWLLHHQRMMKSSYYLTRASVGKKEDLVKHVDEKIMECNKKIEELENKKKLAKEKYINERKSKW